LLLAAAAQGYSLDSLTPQERDWLRAHPVISMATESNWPPIDVPDRNGEQSGIAGDYLTLVEQRLGIKIRRSRNLSWQEAYSRLQRRESDMTTSVARTPEREKFWAFTKPYLEIPIVIVTREHVPYVGGLPELAGRKVAVVDGYAIHEWLRKDHPGITLLPVKSTRDGLEAVRREEAFAYLDNLLVVGYNLTKLKMTDLKVAGETPYVNRQCIAVRKDWAVLAGIIQKALDSVTAAERDEIYRRWVPVRYEHGFNYARFWQAAGVFGAVIVLLLYWNRRLASEIRRREKAEFRLQGLNRDLEARKKEMENFLYITTHDLRTPLVNIQGFSRELADDVKALLETIKAAVLPPEVKEKAAWLAANSIPKSIGFITDSVSKMSKMITALLMISRLGRLEIGEGTVEMAETLKAVADTFKYQLDETGGAINIKPLPPCRGDAAVISQIFLNLLGNAVKYRHPGRKPEITVTGRRIGTAAVLYTVSDNGLGINAYELPMIWDIFYSGYTKEQNQEKGEGLGLAIVKRMTERSKGKVWAESEEGKGSRFFVELPASADASREPS